MAKCSNPYCTCDPCNCEPVCTCGLERESRKGQAYWDDATQTMRYEVVEIFKPKAE